MSRRLSFKDSRDDLLKVLKRENRTQLRKIEVQFKNNDVPDYLRKFKMLQEREKYKECDLIFK